MFLFKRFSILGLALALIHSILVALAFDRASSNSSLLMYMHIWDPEFFMISWIFRMYSWGPGNGIYSGWMLYFFGGIFKWYFIGYFISLFLNQLIIFSKNPKRIFIFELVVSIPLIVAFLIYAIPDYYGYWYKQKENKEYVELVKNGEVSEVKVLYFMEIKNAIGLKEGTRLVAFGTMNPRSKETSDYYSFHESWPVGIPDYHVGDIIKVYHLDKPEYYRYHVRKSSPNNVEIFSILNSSKK